MEGSSFLPFRRVLVTGASGFVGRRLVAALRLRLAPGAMLYHAARSSPVDPAQGGEQVVMDLEDAVSVDRQVAAVRPDLVLHLAAQSSVERSGDGGAATTWSVNLGGSLALGRSIARHAPECTTLFASSAEVYGLAFNSGQVDEHSLILPQSPYARSKAAAEAMFADVLPASVRLIVVRPCNHSGPGQGQSFVIPAFAAQIARAERSDDRVIFVGGLAPERDFLDVGDVVSAYMLLLERSGTLPQRTLFNVASGSPVRVGDLLDRLRAMSLVPTIVQADPLRMRASEVPTASINAGQLRRTTGWAPTHSLDAMLADVLDEERKRLAAT